jgi:hypothetical protein
MFSGNKWQLVITILLFGAVFFHVVMMVLFYKSLSLLPEIFCSLQYAGVRQDQILGTQQSTKVGHRGAPVSKVRRLRLARTKETI